MKFFRIGTGSAGGTYFPIGGLIANAISNPPGSRPCDKGGNCGVPGLVAIAQSTNASAHNVTAINAGQMEAGLTGAATLYFAYHGTAKFEGKKKPICNTLHQNGICKRKWCNFHHGPILPDSVKKECCSCVKEQHAKSL